MNSDISLRRPLVLRSLLGVVLVLVLANIYTLLLRYQFGVKEVWMTAFNMDHEFNIPTLFAVFLIGLAAFLLWVIAGHVASSGSPRQKQWRLLRNVFVFLAADEFFQFHEAFTIKQLKQLLPPFLSVVWIIPYCVALVVLLVCLRPLIGSLSSRMRFLMVVSFAVFLAGAVGMESLGHGLVQLSIIRLHSIEYGLISCAEEALEMIGMILFVNALYDYSADSGQKSLRLNIDVKPF